MTDSIFSNPRLAAIYDHFDGPRKDLDHYLAITKELHANSIIDVGCGTGTFASLLSELGYAVTAVDPAEASLEIAQSKLGSERVQWILGDASNIPSIGADLAFMTGNVAQVFLTEKSWERCLTSIHHALNTKGHFVFEVRDPQQEDWKNWTKEKTYNRLDIAEIGIVEGWCELIDVSNELVTFRWTYIFTADGVTLTSDSTLRFREPNAIESALKKTGFSIDSVRDAPDRPGKEFVFVCSLL